MKFLLLLLLTFSLGLSADKKIIVGSYEHKEYATNALQKINKIIEKDSVLKNLITKNSITVKTQTLGQYNVVSLSYFKSYVQLLRTLESLSQYYDDAYVLPSYKAPVAVKEKLKVVPVKVVPLKKVPTVEQISTTVAVVSAPIQEKEKEEKVVKIEEHVQAVKEQDFDQAIRPIVIIVLILLLILIGIAVTIRKKADSADT